MHANGREWEFLPRGTRRWRVSVGVREFGSAWVVVVRVAGGCVWRVWLRGRCELRIARMARI
jgi:hypothetical protein